MKTRAPSAPMMLYVFFTLVLLLTLYYGAFSLSGFGVDNPIDIYWLDRHNIGLRLLLSLVIIPLGTIAFFLAGWRRRIRSTAYWVAVVFLLAVNVFACGASYGGILREYNELSSWEVGNIKYYALRSEGMDVGFGHPRPLIDIYECDQLGVLCRIVYTYDCGRPYCDEEHWLDRWK